MFTNLPRRPIALAIDAALVPINLTPSIFDMKNAFDPIDQLLESLYQGEIDVEDSVPVMRDWDGWCEISPAIHGWTDCWERISQRMGKPVHDLAFMRRLANRLASGILLDISDIDRAKAIVNRCRALYFACPLWIRKSAVQDEMIAIAMDELGLREAA